MIVRIRRRRGAGMTEYIILVGLIAIGIVGAIKNYQYIIDITIRGSGDKLQKEGADEMNGGNNNNNNNNNDDNNNAPAGTMTDDQMGSGAAEAPVGTTRTVNGTTYVKNGPNDWRRQ